MNLRIERMTPSLAADYFDFFDNRAFSDGSPYGPCYCCAFQMTKSEIEEEFFAAVKAQGSGHAGLEALRTSAARRVAAGLIQGYLAYDGDVVVGWCNVNDRRSYVRVGEFSLDAVPQDDTAPECGAGEVKSVVCFEVAPGYRGKGIATALLTRACEDAQREGFACIEGYPIAREEDDPLDFTGPVRLYEKLGFSVAERQGNRLTMRRKLKSARDV